MSHGLRELVRKEFLHLERDPRALGLALGIPIVLTLFFGYVLTLDVRGVRLGVIDRDRSPASRSLVASLARMEELTPVPLEGQRIPYAAFQRNRLHGVLVIPSGWGKDPQEALGLVVDGRDPTRARVVIRDLETAVTEFLRKRLVGSGPVSLPQITFRVRYNPELRSQVLIVPGILALILLVLSALLPAISLARELETGTLEQLWITPVRRTTLFLGKLLPYFFLGYLQVTVVLALSVWLFRIPVRGNLLLFYFLTTFFLFAATGLGATVASLTRNQQSAMQFTWLLTFLPSFFLSGFIFPLESMPWVLRVLSFLVPARYFLSAVRGVLLRGALLGDVLPDLIALWGFAGGLTLLALRSLRRGVL